MDIYILLIELEQMEQNDINATGYDLNMNYSLPNGYTQSVGGFGYQIIFPKEGGVHFYNYYQYGAGIAHSGGLNAGISGFVVRRYNEDSYVGRSNAISVQIGPFIGQVFSSPGGDDSPCGESSGVAFPSGIGISYVDQEFTSINRILRYEWIQFNSGASEINSALQPHYELINNNIVHPLQNILGEYTTIFNNITTPRPGNGLIPNYIIYPNIR
jgi:hypothetical protein